MCADIQRSFEYRVANGTKTCFTVSFEQKGAYYQTNELINTQSAHSHLHYSFTFILLVMMPSGKCEHLLSEEAFKRIV